MLRVFNLFLVVVLFSKISFAASPILELVQNLNKFKIYQADFMQVTKAKSGKILQITHGTVSLKRPNQFRWQVTKPYRQILWSDGKKMHIHDQDLNETKVFKLSKKLYNSPLVLLTGHKRLIQKLFKISHIKKSEEKTIFWLKPKRHSRFIKSMRVVFKKGVLTGLGFIDTLKHQNSIFFSKIKINY